MNEAGASAVANCSGGTAMVRHMHGRGDADVSDNLMRCGSQINLLLREWPRAGER
jgi:hypothetical protein